MRVSRPLLASSFITYLVCSAAFPISQADSPSQGIIRTQMHQAQGQPTSKATTAHRRHDRHGETSPHNHEQVSAHRQSNGEPDTFLRQHGPQGQDDRPLVQESSDAPENEDSSKSVDTDIKDGSDDSKLRERETKCDTSKRMCGDKPFINAKRSGTAIAGDR